MNSVHGDADVFQCFPARTTIPGERGRSRRKDFLVWLDYDKASGELELQLFAGAFSDEGLSGYIGLRGDTKGRMNHVNVRHTGSTYES